MPRSISGGYGCVKQDVHVRRIRFVFPCALSLFIVLGGCDSDGGAVFIADPQLEDLQFAAAQSGLNPEFDPDISRYSVIMDDMGTPLVMAPSANSLLTISVDGAVVASDAEVTLDSVVPGDTVEISVMNSDGETNEYEVVVLPSAFPVLETTVLEPGVSDGYIYLGLRGQQASYLTIVNNHGVPIYFQEIQDRVFDFKLHPNGQRSYARATGTQNE